MLHGLRIVLLVSIAALVLLPALAWLTVPWLTPSLARPWLEARGVILEGLVVERPGFAGIAVPALGLRHPASGLDLTATGIELRWRDPGSLLRGDLARIDIERLAMTRTPPEDDPESAPLDPGGLLSELPATRLRVHQLVLNTQPGGHPLTVRGDASAFRTASGAALRFHGSLSARALPAETRLELELDSENELRLAVTPVSDGPPWLRLDGRLLPRTGAPDYAGRLVLDLTGFGQWYGTPPGWPTGELDLMLYVRPTAHPQLQLKSASRGGLTFAETATVRLAPDADFLLGIDPDGRLRSRGALGLAVTWRENDREGDLRVHLEDLGGELLRPMASATAIGDLGWPGGGGSMKMALTATLDQPARALEIARDARVEFLQLVHDDWRLSGAHLRSANPILLGLDPPRLRTAARFGVDLDDPGRLSLKGRVDIEPGGTLALTIDQANLPLAENDLAAAFLPETWGFRAGRLMANGVVHRTPEGHLSARLESDWRHVGLDAATHRLRGMTGSTRLAWTDAALRFDGLDTVFERVELAGLPGSPLRLEDGRLTGEGGATVEASSLAPDQVTYRLRIQRALTDAFTIDALDIQGGVEGDHVTAGLRADRADAGIALHDLYCDFRYSAALHLQECGAALLGGEIRIPGGHLHPTGGSGYIPIALTGIDLGAVLALMQTPTLSGEGTLDGSLPVMLEDFRPEVEQGWIAARPPGGRIRYRPAAGVMAAIDHPALRTTLRALEDLRYERLTTRADYHRDGTLLLAVELYGSNPLIEDGRPIELSLNVEQNLLQLLRSLRFARGLGLQGAPAGIQP